MPDPSGDGFAIGAAVVLVGVANCPAGRVVVRRTDEDFAGSRLFYGVAWPFSGGSEPDYSFVGWYSESELAYAS